MAPRISAESFFSMANRPSVAAELQLWPAATAPRITCRRAARPFFPVPSYSPYAAPPFFYLLSAPSSSHQRQQHNTTPAVPATPSSSPLQLPWRRGEQQPSAPIQKTTALRRAPALAPSDVRRVLDKMCSSPDGSARCRLAVLLRSEQHAVMPVGGLLFLRSPVVVIVHPGETATLLVRFRIDVIFL
ncbi:hypothetical protein Zm00014a_041178 [Zea mays]|uniref:Uncharacterized protein n=1 Tax=Zea mays TaxID=4577 RepID=A0A3L6E2V9_MAIZE|nr:hypothetical protein Zm00014a_041178 [Zea mays]